MKRSRTKLRYLVSIPALAALAAGCAAATKQQEAAPEPRPDAAESALRSEMSELKTMIRDLTARIDTLDVKMAGLNEKVNSAQVSIDNLLHTRPLKTQAVAPALSELRGEPGGAGPTDADPDTGFAGGEAVQLYRDAMIMFEAGKYPESILEFSTFLKQHPDHPLAGSAQFHVGESYFRQKEFKLALEEFKRVLVSYDRSPHLPDTLRRMIEAEEALARNDEAGRHRHMLLSLFPHSPAAKGLMRGSIASEPARPVESPAPESPPLGAEIHQNAVPTADESVTNGMEAPPMTAPLPEPAGTELQAETI